MPLRAVILSNGAVPALGGSGSSVLLSGLGEALKKIGYAVTYVVAWHEKKWEHPDVTQDEVLYIESDSTVVMDDSLPHEARFYQASLGYLPSMQRVLTDLEPDVVFCYSCSTWSVFRRVKAEAQRVLVTVDMEYEVLQMRWRLQQGLRNLGPRNILRRVRRSYHKECLRALEYTYAREAGLVLCCAAHHADELRQAGGTVHYVPAPVAGASRRRNMPDRSGPVKVCLLGNLEGTQTRHGLRYFFNEVWPLYLRSDLVGKIRFIVVGGGQLPSSIPWPSPHPDLVATGYVQDLDAALEDITALLVPIPITLGFRMRILDAFKHAIAVITHVAARAGMPQLTDANSFLCSSPGEFLDVFRQVLEHPQSVEQRALAGAACFDRVFAAGKVAGKLAPLLEVQRTHMAE